LKDENGKIQDSFKKNFYIPRGKLLGGCSSVNAMIYVRGNKYDYDNWAKLVNDNTWNYENVLPYFKKSENFQLFEKKSIAPL
jgi:choline dehydrogenase